MAFVQENKAAGLFMGMGLGKTATVLHAFADLPGPTLLVGPIRVIETVWHKEAVLWEATRNLSFSIVRGSPKKRREALEAETAFYLANPEMLEWVLEQKGRPRFRNLIVDESTMFKNPSTKRFKILRRHLKEFERRVIMTGTPVPNSLMDLWSQIFLLDQGERLDTAFGRFKNRFFYQVDYQGYKYEAHGWAKDAILEKCQDLLYQVRAEDVFPPRHPSHIPIPVVLPADSRKVYDRMEKEAFAEIREGLAEGSITAATAAAKVMKLRQVASGFVYDDDGNDVEIHRAKIEALQELLDQTFEPVILVYHFQHELRALQKAFPHGVKFEAEHEEAWNRGEIDLLFMHPQGNSHGLNLQFGGSKMIIFSGTYSYEQLDQIRMRIDRPGQDKPIFYYYLLAEDTVDHVLKAAVEGKATNQDDFLKTLQEYMNARSHVDH